MEFFLAGAPHDPIETWCPEECDGSPHRERLALCANRVGKTEGMGGYETVLHLTGRYPAWWRGHRVERPIEAWAAGKSNETTRDIIQAKLFGPVAYRGREKSVAGTGLIPAEDVGSITWKRGVANLIDTVKVKNRFGGWSEIGLKSYEQGRGAFEGTEKDIIWFDEEPPLEIFTEAHMRLMTRRGHALLTFTPLEGMSEVVQAFLPGGRLPGEVDF
jgi:phage terminase large subunit-like protein